MEVVKSFLFLIVLLSSLSLSAVSQVQDQTGFISIDSGILQGYNSSFGINYVSDSGFIDTGENQNISSEINVTSIPKEYLTLRSFPDGAKSCYVLKPRQGKKNKYLIRAGFMYGNYDNKRDVPRFDLYLGVNWWVTVALDDADSPRYAEIIYTADSDTIDVCLVNTGFGTPFISVLELRLLDNDTYVSESRALLLSLSCDYGSDRLVRFPDDVYDRSWTSCDDDRYHTLRTNSNIESVADGKYKLPSVVMKTAEVATNIDNSIELDFWSGDPDTQFYVYLYFAEIQELEANHYREFNIYINDEFWRGPIVPKHLQTSVVHSNSTTRNSQLYITINKTGASTLPPLLNALEVYNVKEFSRSETHPRDVDAIMDIKSTYNLAKYWQGDPCQPEFAIWDGLNCTYNDDDSPRIIFLDLSSSGLTGNIAPSIFDLKMLQYLDLSNNSLTGPVPDFLAKLPFLRVINLAQNYLSGSIPPELIERSKNGSLTLSVHQNRNICSSTLCKHKFIIPLVATVGATFVLVLIALAIFWAGKRRKQGGIITLAASPNYQGRRFAYSEVLSITNNLEKVLGRGNLGPVYHGNLDEIPVAVKIFSESYVHGYRQFQADAKIITKVQHRQLTTCLGYFEEGNDKGLIYEFMSNGSLEDILSGRNANCLSWQERLQIAMDVAQGLDYMHNTCKPPIIHSNLKPTNILLNENYQAKLVDFGLSKIFTAEGGSTEYVDPEYHVTNKYTERSDVYGFGIVLLAIITNRPIISNDKTHISQWVSSLMSRGDIKSVVDPRLEGDYEIDSVWKAVELAMACASQYSADRPQIKQVVMELNQCLAMEMTRISRASMTIEMVTVNLSTSLAPQAR